MIAAKLLMSLVTSAVATEKAAMVTMSSPSRTTRTARPAQLMCEPEPAPTATTTASKTNIIIMPGQDRARSGWRNGWPA